MLPKFALRRPVTILMGFVCAVVLGLMSSQWLPLAKFPEVEFPGLYISMPYQGSTPAEIERLITRPAEDVLGTVSKVKRMSTFSRENEVGIQMSFDWGEDIGIKVAEVREKLDSIRDDLPTDFQRYYVYTMSTADEELLEYRISSKRNLKTSYDLLDRRLKRRIERLEGVSKVELYGVQKRQLRVELSSARMAAHRIDPGALFNTLQNANFAVGAGRITDGGRRLSVQPIGDLTSPEDLENVIVGEGPVRLKDVATVSYKRPKLYEGRHLDREFAIGIDVFKASGYNTVAVADRVNEEIREIGLDPQLEGIELIVTDDQAASVKSSIREVISAGALGAVLSFFVLFLFLRQWSTTLIVSLSVPISILVTLAGLYFLGFSLNVLSLMGLMLAVGMLVDNAVVITESIHQERLKNPDDENATINGVKAVSLAVIAGTITTGVVFMPAIVSPADQVTLFLKHVAMALIIALTTSLIISQTVIPILTNRIKPPKRKETFVDRIVDRYGRLLGWTLRHRWLTFFGIVGLLLSTAVPIGFVSFDFFPNEDGEDSLELVYHINSAYTVDRVEEEVTRMEDYLYAHQDAFEFESVYSYFTDNFAFSRIYLREDERTKSNEEIQDEILAGMPTVVIGDPMFDWGGRMNGERLSVSLVGPSSERLIDLSDDVVRTLASVEGLTNVRSSAEVGGEEVRVRVDRQRAPQQGLSADQVATTVAAALRGLPLRTLRTPEGEVDVTVAFQDADRQTVADLTQLPIVTDDGRQLPLAAVADLEIARGPSTIRRDDRRTVLGIELELLDIDPDEARDRITAVMDQVRLPDGYTWTFGRSFSDAQQSENIMLINMLLALALIYLVMAALFESLITPAAIWTSIIFAIIGVMWFFLFTGTVFSVMAWIGILVLIGIVVNNGIVLLDHVIELRAQGLSRTDAVLQGGQDRLRPILMTAATTVLGLLPLCVSTSQIGGDGPQYFPMARAIVGGLTFSTVVTLVVLPSIYLWLDDLKLWGRRVAATVKSRS